MTSTHSADSSIMESLAESIMLRAVIGHSEPGKFCADLIHRVLALYLDEGNPDPRHSEHWWDWTHWPVDGRQWEHDGQLQRYTLDKKAVAEHENRLRLGGIGGSKLKIERKLEGTFWGEKMFPKGRTTLRSSASFPAQLFESLRLEDDDSDDDEQGEEEPECWLPLFMRAGILEHRSQYDASIYDPHKIRKIPRDEKFKQDFKDKISSLLVWGAWFDMDLLDVSFYMCTDGFALKGEQQSAETIAIPSIMVSAYGVYEDTSGKYKSIGVVAEAPMLSSGFADQLDDRIAGFVFMDDDTKEEPNAAHVTYVESSFNDLQTLGHNEKDALLEDRALIVHRLVKNAIGEEASDLPQVVSSPFYLPRMKPQAHGLPPTRTLDTLMTVHRADPRWPLDKPNSRCLECGVDPKLKGDKMFVCTKCSIRSFCSNECMKKSWRSETWSHKLECNRICNHEQSMVGQSMRDMMNQLVDIGQVSASTLDSQMSTLEKHLGQASLDEKFDSVSEMREKHREDAKGHRKARKAAKKKKKGKKK